MKKLNHLLAFSVVLAISFFLAACAGGPTKVESDMGIKGAPDWVNEGTQTLKTKDGRLFHGVGSASSMGDLSFQTSVADNRARAEIARILSSYMDIAFRDYMASGKADEHGYTEQTATREINNVTKVNLTGARIIGHWRDTKSNMIFAIAELDMKHVKETLKNVDTMNQGFKEFMGAKGENIFDRIADDKES